MAKKKSIAPTVKRRKSTWEDRFADKFIAQPAQITPEERDAIDARFSSNEPWRRLALVTLTQSGSQLIETVNESRENALQVSRAANLTSEYASMLRDFADLMDTASTRLNIALCSRPDMQAVIDEVKTVDSGQAVGHA